MQPLLSIIVAVYNVEDYLEKCLTSLSNDAVEKSLVEVLIVDDASKDNAWSIIERFCRANANFRAIRHEVNLGPGFARNTGLDHCSGQYVWFVDGDDYIDSERVPEILQSISQNTPDVFVVRPKGIDINGREFVHHASRINSEAERLIPIDEYYAKNPELGYSWLYISRLDIINNSNIRFKPMRFMEDADFYVRLFINCTNVWVSNITCYNYVKRPSSITNDTSEEGLTQRLVSLSQVHVSLSAYLEAGETRAQMKKALSRRLAQIEYSMMCGYLFTRMSSRQAERMIAEFAEARVYPFRWHPERWSAKNAYLSLAKLMANCFPIFAHRLNALMLYPTYRATKRLVSHLCNAEIATGRNLSF